MAVAFRNVEAATLASDGSPPITRTTFPTCRAYYPGGSSGCACRLLPRSCSLPQMAGGSASALSLSRPAQASLTLRPTGSLSHPRWPLSRGSDPASYPAKPLASFRTYRHLSGWDPPSLMIHAFGAHCQLRTHALQQMPRALIRRTKSQAGSPGSRSPLLGGGGGEGGGDLSPADKLGDRNVDAASDSGRSERKRESHAL